MGARVRGAKRRPARDAVPTLSGRGTPLVLAGQAAGDKVTRWTRWSERRLASMRLA
jgi:hypothetical protein